MTPTPAELRVLTDRERGLLKSVLALADFPGRSDLAQQVDHARVSGGQPLILDLVVVAEIRPADLPSGPIPTRAVVSDAANQPLGEVIIWVQDGYLSGLEYAWLTDEPPSSMPEPEQLVLYSN